MFILIHVCLQGSSAGHGDPYSRPLPQPQTYVTFLPRYYLLAIYFSSLANMRSFSLVIPSADDLSSQEQFEVPEAGGWDATLSGEDEDDFFDLQIVKHYDGEVGMRDPQGTSPLKTSLSGNRVIITKCVCRPPHCRSKQRHHGTLPSTRVPSSVVGGRGRSTGCT